MDAYTLHLLGLAVETLRAKGHGLILDKPQSQFGPDYYWFRSGDYEGDGDSAAEALTALLTDLGVEVPKRPSAADAERMVGRPFWKIDLEDMTALYARDRLAAIALLEGGAS